MTPLSKLSGPARRRCLRMARKVRSPSQFGCLFVRGEDSFRDAERLHHAGLVTVVVSKWSWDAQGRLVLGRFAPKLLDSHHRIGLG